MVAFHILNVAKKNTHKSLKSLTGPNGNILSSENTYKAAKSSVLRLRLPITLTARRAVE